MFDVGSCETDDAEGGAGACVYPWVRRGPGGWVEEEISCWGKHTCRIQSFAMANSSWRVLERIWFEYTSEIVLRRGSGLSIIVK
jgi:hypothetical protein